MNSIERIGSGHTHWIRHTGLSSLFLLLIFATLVICASERPALGAGWLDIGRQSGAAPRQETQASDSGWVFCSEPSGQGAFPSEAGFSLGRAALENGDYETALTAFEGVSSDPAGGMPADRDQCGGSYSPGAMTVPGERFNEAPAQNASEAVGLSISRKLQALKSSRKEHFISANIALGLDIDEDGNVERPGTDAGISATLGNVVTVTVDRPEKALSSTGRAVVNYLYKPVNSQLSWNMSGTTYNAAYRHDADVDVSLSDFKAGMSVGRGRVVWEMYGMSNRLSLDYDRYLHAYGAGSSLSLSLSEACRIKLDGKIRRKTYYTDDSMDAQNVNVSLAPVFSYGRNRLSLNVGMEYQNAREDAYSFAKLNGIATYEARLPFSSRIYVTYWYQETGYGDIYPLLSAKRDYTSQYVVTGFSKTASIWKSPSSDREMALNMSYTYTRAESDIDLETYTKNVLTAGMSMVF